MKKLLTILMLPVMAIALCAGCVRWSECNGVDEECPWRKKNA